MQEDHKTLRRMREFAFYVSDMVAYLNDKYMPRELADVCAEDFSLVVDQVNAAIRHDAT